MEKHLSTYHLIRKAIYNIKNSTNWQDHPILEELQNHSHTNIPPPPTEEHNKEEWIINLATIAKTANIEARKITTKYIQENIKKAISKYRQLYEKSPKKLNKKVFKNHEIPPLNCIKDRNNNILTNPEDIANKSTFNNQSVTDQQFQHATTKMNTQRTAHAKSDGTHGMT